MADDKNQAPSGPNNQQSPPPPPKPVDPAESMTSRLIKGSENRPKPGTGNQGGTPRDGK